jgi:hypothetical protein
MPTAGPPRRDRQPEAQQLPAKTSFRSLDRLRDGRAVDDLEPGPQPGCCTAWASSAIAWRIWVVAGDRILPLLISSSTLRAQLSDQDLTQREHGRAVARRGLPDPAATARAIALAICEVEAGLRSASQLERVCHHSLWQPAAPARNPRRERRRSCPLGSTGRSFAFITLSSRGGARLSEASLDREVPTL